MRVSMASSNVTKLISHYDLCTLDSDDMDPC